MEAVFICRGCLVIDRFFMIKSISFFRNEPLKVFIINFDFIIVQILKHNPMHRNLTDLTLKNMSTDK